MPQDGCASPTQSAEHANANQHAQMCSNPPTFDPHLHFLRAASNPAKSFECRNLASSPNPYPKPTAPFLAKNEFCQTNLVPKSDSSPLPNPRPQLPHLNVNHSTILSTIMLKSRSIHLGRFMPCSA
jgi:hypothetical protein